MFGINPGKQPSVMKHDFSRVPKAEIQRSQFNRSHGLKLPLTLDILYRSSWMRLYRGIPSI